MLLPTKYEDLRKNILVLGSDLIFLLKKKNYNIEILFRELKNNKDITLEEYYNTLTFLYCSELISVNDYLITLNKNVSQ